MSLRNRSFYDKSGFVTFVTTTVVEFTQVFSLGEVYNEILLNSMKYLNLEHNAELFAYVIMPNHIHFIIALPQNESVSD